MAGLARRAAHRDRVRQRRRALHVADAAVHPRHGAAGLRHQRPDQGPVARGVLLCARRRRRTHARDAADDRHGVPLQGRHGDGEEESHRQAHQRHPEPRRDGRAVHRQDRHAHDGPRHSEHALRRRPEAGQRRARARVSQQSLPDGPEERHGSRRAGARGTGAPQGPDSRLRQGGRDPVRLRAAHHVGRRPHARRQGSHHQQRGAGGDLSPLHELRARRPALPDGARPHRRAPQRIRAARPERIPRAGHCVEGRRPAAALPGVWARRRMRSDPQRLSRVPRSAEGDARRRPSRRSRRTASP